MKLRNPEDRIKGLNGVFRIKNFSYNLSKVSLIFEKPIAGKTRWFQWFDHTSITEIEAKHELLKVFCSDTDNRNLLNINSSGA